MAAKRPSADEASDVLNNEGFEELPSSHKRIKIATTLPIRIKKAADPRHNVHTDQAKTQQGAGPQNHLAAYRIVSAAKSKLHAFEKKRQGDPEADIVLLRHERDSLTCEFNALLRKQKELAAEKARFRTILPNINGGLGGAEFSWRAQEKDVERRYEELFVRFNGYKARVSKMSSNP